MNPSLFSESPIDHYYRNGSNTTWLASLSNLNQYRNSKQDASKRSGSGLGPGPGSSSSSNNTDRPTSISGMVSKLINPFNDSCTSNGTGNGLTKHFLKLDNDLMLTKLPPVYSSGTPSIKPSPSTSSIFYAPDSNHSTRRLTPSRVRVPTTGLLDLQPGKLIKNFKYSSSNISSDKKIRHQFNNSLIISSPVVLKSQTADVEIDNAFLTSDNDFATQEEMMRVKTIYQNIYGGSPNDSISYQDRSLNDGYNHPNNRNDSNNSGGSSILNWKSPHLSMRRDNSLQILMEIDNAIDPRPPSLSTPSSTADSTMNSTFGSSRPSGTPLGQIHKKNGLETHHTAVITKLRDAYYEGKDDKQRIYQEETTADSEQSIEEDDDTSSNGLILNLAQLSSNGIKHGGKTIGGKTISKRPKESGKRKPNTTKPKGQCKRKSSKDEGTKPQLLITLKLKSSNDDIQSNIGKPPSSSSSSLEAKLEDPDSDYEYKPGTRQTRSKRRRTTKTTREDVYVPEKKRRLGPRSKSGCWTCRVRHKACPEDRPVCGQCIRLHLPCDYSNERPLYMIDPVLQASKLKEIRDVTNLQKKINFAKRRVSKH